MTEPINQNAISLYCPECNTKIPPEVLEDNNDPNVVCCPSCGVIIPIEPQIEIPEITQEKSEESPQIQVQQPSPRRTAKWHLKLLVYFAIHDLLYSKVSPLLKIKKQKQLRSITLKRYAKQLRSKLLYSPISRDFLTRLNPREQRKLKRVFQQFKETIKDKKQFRKYQIQSFMEGIQFIFDVMSGDYECVTFSSTEKEIIMELKDKVNPFKDMRSKRSLGRAITVIFARIIHQRLFALSRTNEPLTPDLMKEFVDRFIDQLSAQDCIEWIESQVNIKLDHREKQALKTIQVRLNNDWIQGEYFSDLLVSTIDAVHALMDNMTGEVPTNEFSRILLQGFEKSELFRLDKAFSNREKLNITIVLARMIYAQIFVAFPPPRQINPNQKLPPALHRDIGDTILEGLVDHLEINSEFLLRFYNFALDKFHAAIEKLLEKLEGDMIYRASFKIFLTNLIETVFKVTRQEPKESKLSPLELRIREDLELYPYDWRKKNFKLFEDEKETDSIEPSDDLYHPSDLEKIPVEFGLRNFQTFQTKSSLLELIKTCIEQIIINRGELARFHREDLKNKFEQSNFEKGFKFRKSGLFSENSKSDINSIYKFISPHNIGVFLGARSDTIRKWVSAIENEEIYFHTLTEAEKAFRKLRPRILGLFGGKGKNIEKGRVLIENAIKKVLVDYFGELDYIKKIITLLEDCTIWERKSDSKEHPNSMKSISLALGQNRSYISYKTRTSETDKEFNEFVSIFNFTTNILRIKKKDFDFKSEAKYYEFRTKALEIYFEELVEQGIFIEELKLQYDALVYTLFALTQARFEELKDTPNELQKYITDKNPQGFFSIKDLSKHTSQFDRRHGIQENIKSDTWMSPEKVSSIQALLIDKQKFAPKTITHAQVLIKELPRHRVKNRASYVGRNSHPILENWLRKALFDKGIESRHEQYFNLPISQHRIDSLIDVTQKGFLDFVSKDLKTYIESNKFNYLFIDFNIPSVIKAEKTASKGIKFYHSEDHPLYIVFYGPYGSKAVDAVRKKLEQLDNIQHKEGIRLINIFEFVDLLGLANKCTEELIGINDLIKRALYDRAEGLPDLKNLEEMADDALLELKNYENKILGENK